MKTTKIIKLTDKDIDLLMVALSTENLENDKYIKNLKNLGWLNELKEAKAYSKRIDRVFNKLLEVYKNEKKS